MPRNPVFANIHCITMEFLHNFFLDPDLIFSSHTMFINASTKEFTLVNNAIPSYDITFEHLLYILQVSTSHIMNLYEVDISLITIDIFHRYNIQY